jgi:YegS/Rv2252/BmrU family lipid kinase
MGPAKISFIVNPNAGMGSAAKQWPLIKAMAENHFGSFSFHFTTGTGDATKLARAALQNRSELIICVGGDGTLNEVVNGFFENDHLIHREAMLGLIPNGTGCDLIKTIPISRRLEKAMQVIVEGHARPLDLGRLSFKDHRGQWTSRYFHNVTSFGLGGEVVERANRTTKVFGGFVSFIWATLISVMLHRKKRIKLRIDDQPEASIVALNIAVANGQYHGGGMWIAPGASAYDGLLNVTMVGNLTLPQVFWHLPKLYNGKIFELKEVQSVSCRSIHAYSEEKVLLEMDGEQPGQLPAKIDMVPAAISLIVPRS